MTGRLVTARTADARNRAARALIVNLAIDVGVALLLVLVTAFASAESWGDLQWSLIALSLVKTGLASTGSYVLRRYVDPSGIPTPLPPAEAGAPDDTTGA